MKKNMMKNSSWNRLFHAKDVKANVELKARFQKLVNLAPDFISRIGCVTYREGDVNSARVTGAQSLMGLISIHKELWAAGFQNENLGADSYGMFRTESIPTMKPEEVFLGNIWGLYTKNIPFWDKYKDEGKTGGGYPIYEYLTVYQIVLSQYKILLSSNVKAIEKNATEQLEELKKRGYWTLDSTLLLEARFVLPFF